MNINNVIDSVINVFSWIYSQTGLKNWQLLIIASGVLLLLVLFLANLRKKRAKRKHLIHTIDRSDTIGINLTGNAHNYQLQQQSKESPLFFDSEEDEKQRSWGQTTKDWRQLREKIRQLQHDIRKYERTEEYLEEKIAEQKSINEKLMTELNERVKNEEELVRQVDKLTDGIFNNKHNEAGENALSSENMLELQKNIKRVSESLEITPKQKEKAEKQDDSNQNQSEQKNDEQITFAKESKEESTDLLQIAKDISSLKHGLNAKNLKTDTNNQSDNSEDHHSVPLDIKELKSISDFAKRLQTRGQKRQV